MLSLDNLGNWSAVGGDAVTVVTDASDATYVESPANPAIEQVRYKLDPLGAGSITIDVRAQASAIGYVYIRTVLQEGTTTIAEWTDDLTTSWQDFSHTTTGSQESAITDRSNLYVVIEAN